MAIQKYSDYINEEKKKKETVLPTATKQNTSIQKYSDYIKTTQKNDEKNKKEIEKQVTQNNTSKTNSLSYIGNSALTGVTGGVTGVANAALNDTANDLKKGSKKSIVNSALDLLNSVFKWSNPIKAITDNTIDSLKRNFIDDKNSNILQKIVNSALDIASPETPVNKTVQLYGSMLPGNTSDKVLQANETISQPYNRLKQKTQEQAQTQSPAMQLVGNTVQNVAQMVPSIAATAITKNPNVGLAVMGLSSKGLSTEEAKEKGAELEKAIKIGNIKGQIEIGTEMLTGGLNVFGKGTLDDLVKKGIIEKAKTTVRKYLLEKGYELGGELVEETISDVVGTIIDKGTVDENASYSLKDWSDTALVTILSTLALNTLTGGLAGKANKVGTNASQKSINGEINNTENFNVDSETKTNPPISQDIDTQNSIIEVNNIQDSIDSLKEVKQRTADINQQQNIENQIKELREQQETLIEKIEGSKINAFNKKNIPFVKQSFSEQVDSYINNTFPSNQLLNLGDTPKLLQNIGLKNNPITMTQKALKHIITESQNDDHMHGIDINIVKSLPEAISRPLNVLYSNSSTKGDSIVVITDLADNLERPIIASILIDDKGRIGNVDFFTNNLTSAYGKSDYESYMEREINKGNLLYDIDDGIIKELAQTRVQSSTSPNSLHPDNSTNNSKSQIAPLPNNSNMQNNEKNILLPSARVQNEINEMEGLKAADEAFGLSQEETKKLESLRKKYDKEYVTKKKFESAERKTLTQATKEAKDNLGLTAKESKEFREKLQKLTKNTKEELTNELAKNDIKKIISDYAERTITYKDSDIADVKKQIRNQNIKVSDYLKNQITDYGDFKKRNFGKLKLTKEGIPVDVFYAELVESYPGYFDKDVISDADILETLADFMSKDTAIEETVKLSGEEINDITDRVYNKLLDNSLTLDEIDNIDKEIYNKINKKTRKDVQERLLDEMGITTDDLQVGKDISSLDFQRTDPIRVNEKVFGYKTGNKINDATIRQTKHNEAERTRFLNKERAEIKDLGIKAHSKESAAVQKYGEKQYVTDKGDIVPYGDAQLMAEFPDADTQNKIKNAAKEIRKKYDAYINQINNVITEMGYDPIPKRQDYFRHFQEIGDKLSQWGIPLNADSLSKDTLPTDINGITDQFKPGKNWFASAMQRKGIKTTYDAITGIDGYLEGASNLIYHTEDIQRYRTLSKLVRDTYGQTHGLDNISLDTKEGQQRLNDIFDNKLSKYAAWLDEQANALAGKKGTIDRGVERALGRKIYNVLDAAKKQVGSNMTGFNVRSALTNFASAVQGASKTNKVAWIKGTISTMQNIVHNDGLIDKSDFLTSRFGSNQLSKKMWQKASNAGQIFMTGTDYFTANQIWRSKYYENLSKGMNETQAIKNADDFAARIMGDRSKGSTAEVFNSKTLGLLTQFQLEVNNQWSSIIHDNKMDIKSGNKSGATVIFQLGQLAAMSYLFNNLMRSLTGSDVMIDPIELLKKIIGNDDDDKDKTLEERAREALGGLLDDVPFVSIMNGGRIPMSEAFKGGETLIKYATGQKDKYGNDIKPDDVKKDLIESGFYWLLPTGYSQIKKTTNGASMYNKNLPIAGSYTDSGNLRFTADDSTAGKVKAVLFGQYSSKEAQKYVESGYKTVSQSHIKELQDLNMSSSEYVKYRNKLADAGTTNNEKINYVVNSNYTDKQKNIMTKNILDEKEDKYLTSSQIADNYYDYAKWSTDISELRKSTSNDKEETINYINNLPLSIPQKALFIKTYYKSFKQYDNEIINYIVNQKLTIEEKSSILLGLGYKIRNGKVYTK